MLRTFLLVAGVITFLAPDFITPVDAGAGKNLEQTPQNRVVIILVGFVVFSLIIEHSLEWIVEHFEEQGREGMVEVIEKIKEEFLLVGVLSFVLVGCEETLFATCVGKPFDWWIPAYHCPAVYPDFSTSSSSATSSGASSTGSGSNVSSSAASSTALASSAASSASGSSSRRMLLASSGSAAGSQSGGPTCVQWFGDSDYERMIDVNALHQVHLLIFFLAVGHVIASFVTYYVARFTVKRWAAWEEKLVEGLQEEGHHVTWAPKFNAGKLTLQPCARHFVGWRLVFCGMDAHTLLSLRRFYISRHGLNPKFKIFEMVVEDLEHDFSDVAGIRFWMWIALCVQLAVNGTQSKVSGYYNWGNTFFTMLLAVHLRNIAEDLSDKLWKHFNNKLNHSHSRGEKKRLSGILRVDDPELKQDSAEISPTDNTDIDTKTDTDTTNNTNNNNDDPEKQQIDQINQNFEDHLETIEPVFVCRRPKLLMLWFQLVQWNSSQTITQGIWFGAAGMGCYSAVRGPIVIGIAMTIAFLSLIVMGYTVLPTYALMLHCGEHLRPKGRTHKHRQSGKHELHKKHSMKSVASNIMSQIRARKETHKSTGASHLDEQIEMTTTDGSKSSSKYIVEVD